MQKSSIKKTQLTLFLFFCFLVLFLLTNVIFLIFIPEENYPFFDLGLFFISSTLIILFSDFFSEIFDLINIGFYPSFEKPKTKSNKIDFYFKASFLPFFIYYYQFLAHILSWNFLKLNVDYSILAFMTLPTGLILVLLFHRIVEIFNVFSNIIAFFNGLFRSITFARILFSISLIIFSLIIFVPFYIFLPNSVLEISSFKNASLIILFTLLFLLIGIVASQILPFSKEESVDRKLFVINTQRFYFLVSVNFCTGVLIYFFPNFNESIVLTFVLGIFYFSMLFEMVLRFTRNKFVLSMILSEDEST